MTVTTVSLSCQEAYSGHSIALDVLADLRYICYSQPVKEPRSPDSPWLLLIHQLPSEPSRVRVRTWRRLQAVGAVAVKNSVYVLPDSAEAREDFEWLRAEITANGGEAVVFAARAADALSSTGICEAVESARQRDWQELRAKCRALLDSHGGGGTPAEVDAGELQRQARSLRVRAARIDRIDQLKAPGRSEALAELGRIEKLIHPDAGIGSVVARRDRDDYRGRVWMTRPHPGIDRMASAWLIRKFVDPRARFRFGETPPTRGDVVPFDMFGVGFGHRGERVTFETLMEDFGLGDPVLERIARIVHEIDLKIEIPLDPESPTVAHLVEGLRRSFAEDDLLLDHGMAIFEALYASLSPSTA